MKKQFIVALIGAAFAFPIAAQADNTYVGVNVGRGEQKISIPVVSGKETKTSYKLYGGYNFDKNFGVEGGYVDFGKAKFTNKTYSSEAKSKAFYVAATGTLPVSDEFGVFAKVGLSANRVSYDFKDTGMRGSSSANRSSLIFGLGASYNVTKEIAIVAEYENFGKIAKGDGGGDIKANTFSAGLRYKF
ncbi:outer membrane beta-barrel protein [Janthinobacterium fluminis]|uniref:Outer membrane beta-barrel protein n=1 Tax=Janthinobacterium fluminis TaxID=2987524 RepID=A0ABT5K260_9BURK|nr:outer membrane beta-barrel protein [Janthinobacterium fluminis]MDC8759068.1 outer membrane beta-barrel protein [Janthinobacterium fluminis]